MALRLGIPKKYRGLLRLATTSWKYDTWKGLIYERRKTYRPDDYLADYAKRLDSVEVDQWFYSLFPGGLRLPDPGVVGFYAKSVPKDFVFTVKAPNSLTLTHYYSKQTRRYADFAGKPNPAFLDHDLLGRFLEALSPLRPKLGPVMFQFEYLNKQKMPSKELFIERFGEFIDAAPKGYQYAVEIRNPNFFSTAFFDFLKDRGSASSTSRSSTCRRSERSSRSSSRRRPRSRSSGSTAGTGSRSKGKPGRSGTRSSPPSPEASQSAAKIVRANAKKRVLTYLNLNNHYEGSAPLSIGRFLDVLAGKKIDEAPF